ncbi:MAG: hypothetical protein K6G63_08470 [Eubacterium sp.]|nr:hypothetical protein [Eubacterium sp.]
MALQTYAAINLSSDSISMKIYEISKTHGIKELAHVRQESSVGAEIFNDKIISYKTMSGICQTLKDFRAMMAEFDVSDYNACITDSVREAINRLILMDQIKIQTDFKFKSLSNSEQRFQQYKAIFLKEPFVNDLIIDETLVVDLGAGTVQFSYFKEGRLCFTQNLKLGFYRIRELMLTMQAEIFNFEDIVDEYMDKDLTEFYRIFLEDKQIKNIIVTGQKVPAMRQRLSDSIRDFDGHLSRKAFGKLHISELSKPDETKISIPAFILLKKIAKLTKCSDIYLSAVDFCDSIVAEYAEKKIKLSYNHDFSKDIIYAARNTAERYHTNMAHIDNVTSLATDIFDAIKKFHGLGKRERLLLQLSAILHSCGAFINLAKTRENSYKIVTSTEIIGISHQERIMVANIILYNKEFFPPYSEIGDEMTRDEYITVVKLCAILKLANVLDKSNSQKINKVTMSVKDNILQINAKTLADITLEKGMFHRKADVFEEAFGIRPVLRKRR